MWGSQDAIPVVVFRRQKGPMQLALAIPSENLVMDKATNDKFNRVDQDIRDVNESLKEVNRGLFTLGVEIGELKGASKPGRDVHWLVRNVVAPLLVLLVAGCIGLLYINIDKRMDAIETYFRDNGGFIASLRLQKNGSTPADPKTIQEAKQVLVQARAAKLKIPADVVEIEGKKFVDAGQSNPGAWSVAMDFLSYKSFLDQSSVSLPGNMKPASSDQQSEKYRFSLNFRAVPNGTPGTLMVEVWTVLNPLLSAGNFARMEKLSDPQTGTTQATQIIVDANRGTIFLDDQWLKHVIIENAHIEYKGGQTRIEDVAFLNCTFSLVPDDRSRDLAQAILTSTDVSFSTGVAGRS